MCELNEHRTALLNRRPERRIKMSIILRWMKGWSKRNDLVSQFARLFGIVAVGSSAQSGDDLLAVFGRLSVKLFSSKPATEFSLE